MQLLQILCELYQWIGTSFNVYNRFYTAGDSKAAQSSLFLSYGKSSVILTSESNYINYIQGLNSRVISYYIYLHKLNYLEQYIFFSCDEVMEKKTPVHVTV